MSLQRSVAQQIEEVVAEIQRAKTLPAAGACPWLMNLLTQHGVAPDSGMLVRLSSTPDQGGDLFAGIWLTKDQRFFEFSIIADRNSNELIEVEAFQDVTSAMVVSANLKGHGKSFGYLALQALKDA
ncbi:hypothetical protein [Inhella proteolytica]|uniref:Uncharacterized protein n=1 Tax=Inhella proteolytica TaxID=2795029 RepID=A0A931J6N5_9BURK|nr:hypothetical protein [Inhella proteolytica]MBH9579743.1 hypothetical protein [Inhella proteolytica]